MKKIFCAATACLLILGLCSCSGMPVNTVFSAEDAKGTNIGVLSDTAAVKYAAEQGAVHSYSAADTMMKDLKNGVIDCAVMDIGPAAVLVKKTSRTTQLNEFFAHEDFCFAIAKENADLTKAVNSALQQLENNGVLQKIIDGYIFGTGYKYVSPEKTEEFTDSLTLAVGDEFAPYKYTDAEIKGLDVDVAKAVCDILGVDMKIIEVGSADLISSVLLSKADMALGGLTGQEKDAERVDFSNKYVTLSLSIIVRKTGKTK